MRLRVWFWIMSNCGWCLQSCCAFDCCYHCVTYGSNQLFWNASKDWLMVTVPKIFHARHISIYIYIYIYIYILISVLYIINDSSGTTPILLVCHISPYIKGKAVQLQAWSDPEGSRKLRFPDFMTTAQVVSPTHRPHLPPRNTTGTHFC